MFAVDWSSVTLAGAFVLGAVFGTFATLRVMRAVLGVFRREIRGHRDDASER